MIVEYASRMRLRCATFLEQRVCSTHGAIRAGRRIDSRRSTRGAQALTKLAGSVS